MKIFDKILTKEFLYQEYIVNKRSSINIACDVGCSGANILRTLKKYGISVRTLNDAAKIKNMTKISQVNSENNYITKEFLYKEYIINKKTTYEIAAIINYSVPGLLYKMRKNNIYIRTVKESKALLDVSGKNNPNYIDGRTPLKALIRQSKNSVDLRLKVFKRDKHTCESCRQVGGELNAHHVKSFSLIISEFLKEYDQFSPFEDKETLVRLAMKYKPFWDIGNVQTLCKSCHKKTSNYLKGNKHVTI